MESKQVAIDQQISKARAITIARNKETLKSIAETIIFCGQQGLALTLHAKKLHQISTLAISLLYLILG